jgi:hypothetical protein
VSGRLKTALEIFENLKNLRVYLPFFIVICAILTVTGTAALIIVTRTSAIVTVTRIAAVVTVTGTVDFVFPCQRFVLVKRID